jgi:hypothetical protein
MGFMHGLGLVSRRVGAALGLRVSFSLDAPGGDRSGEVKSDAEDWCLSGYPVHKRGRIFSQIGTNLARCSRINPTTSLLPAAEGLIRKSISPQQVGFPYCLLRISKRADIRPFPQGRMITPIFASIENYLSTAKRWYFCAMRHVAKLYPD